MRSRSAWAAGARNKAAALLLVLGFVVGPTLAPSTARAEDQATKQARQHSRNAKQYFDLGQWNEAIAEYREAYRLRSDPAFLFNIAQAYRRKGDLQPALDLYKNYLIENPTTPKRGDIEKRIQTLEEEMKKRQAASAPAAREPASGQPSLKPTLEAAPSALPQATVTPPALPPALPPLPPPAPALPVPALQNDAGRPVYLAPVMTGGIHIAAVSPARVSVDGQDKGALPLDMPDLYPGAYHVRVELQDGTVDERNVEVVPGRMSRIFIDPSAEALAWAARRGAHLAAEAGVGLAIRRKGSWKGAEGGLGGYLNVGIIPQVEFRAGLRLRYGSLGQLNSVTLLEIPVSFRFNLGTIYTIAWGATVGKRWTNGNVDGWLYPETGYFFGPEVSLLTFRFGRRRQFEVAAVQSLVFPISSSRDDYILAWGSSVLTIFYNTFTFAMVW